MFIHTSAVRPASRNMTSPS